MKRASRKCVGCETEFFTPPSSRKRSCGNAECNAVARKRMGRRHGKSNTRLHNIWCGMKARVKGTAGELARKYYAGLSVADEWSVYETFYDWAMKNGYADGLEIDRKDNSKGYSPDNCRWATRRQQMQNTRVRTQKNKTSIYRGVQFVGHCKKKWRAIVTEQQRPKQIGLYETELEAARAYDEWALKAFGQFASLNIKEE